MKDALTLYWDASTLSNSKLSSLSLAVFLASIESSFSTAAVVDPFKINQDPDLNADLFQIQAGSIACSPNIAYQTAETQEQ